MPTWSSVAPQLAGETSIQCLCEFNGQIFGGTSNHGRLYKWNGIDSWIQVAPQLNGQTVILSLCVFNNKLYGGTGYDGRLFEWNGTDAWVQVAPQLNSQTGIWALCVFAGALYGTTGAPLGGGRLFRWNGADAWVQVAPQLNAQGLILSLCVYNGKLYGGTAYSGCLFEWNGVNAWVQKAPQLNAQSYIYSLLVFGGALYGSTASQARLFRWNDVNAWVQVAPQLPGNSFLYQIVVFYGTIYAVSVEGNLLAWDGAAWVLVAPRLLLQALYSALVSLPYIFCGTASLGNLFRFALFSPSVSSSASPSQSRSASASVSASPSKSLSASPSPSPSPSVSPSSYADFVGAPVAGYSDLTVAFVDLSAGATSWLWDFGDGSTSALQTPPPHLYHTPGLYTVSLSINGGVSVETKPNYISVSLAPVRFNVVPLFSGSVSPFPHVLSTFTVSFSVSRDPSLADAVEIIYRVPGSPVAVSVPATILPAPPYGFSIVLASGTVSIPGKWLFRPRLTYGSDIYTGSAFFVHVLSLEAFATSLS